MSNDHHARARQLLAGVSDPELPMLSVLDLGIVRRIRIDEERPDSIEVDITPTYSGCPALATIEADIRSALATEFATVTVATVLSPPWTTDWMSDTGKARLAEHGIAPPRPTRIVDGVTATMSRALPLLEMRPDTPPLCPRCGAASSELISRHGSTACKSLWRCTSCREPFDEFKPH